MFDKVLGISSVSDKYVSKHDKMFKEEEEAIEILTNNGLI